MRTILVTFMLLAGCATTADVAKRPPYATFASPKQVPAVMSCVRKKLDMFEWGLCTAGEPHALAQNGHDTLVVEGPRGTDAVLEGQQKGEGSVYELRMAKQADWGLCSLSGVFKAMTQACM